MRSAISTCLGSGLIGSYSGYKSGHGLNNKLVRALLEQDRAWEETTFEDSDDAADFVYQCAAGRRCCGRVTVSG